jgi:hypothetical protein
LGDNQKNWHGASAYTIDQINEKIGKKWKIVSYEGILFLPIHHFPVFLRRFFKPIDGWFCRSFFKKYASYLIVTLQKK